MEPFEWLVLGLGLAVGALFGAQGKTVMRSTAKGFMSLEEKTRQLTANMREDFRDAVEEARYEREREAALANGADLHPAITAPPHSAPARRRPRRPSTAQSTAGSQASPARKRGRPKSTQGSDGASGGSHAAAE